MVPKSFLLVGVATGCIAAAGIGGYWAVREANGDRAAGATLGTSASSSEAVPAPPIASSPGTSSAPSAKSSATASKPAKSANAPRQRPAPAATTPPATDPAPAQTAPPVTAADPPATDPVPPPATAVPDPAPVPDTPKPQLDELTIREDSVIGLRLESGISTETARVEDKITARVARDVTVNGRTAIPAGARLEGVVTAVDRGGKFKNRAHLAIRFDSLVLSDNTRMAIQTDAIVRDGDAPGNGATAKVGGSAVVGAILGGLIGGKKGVAIGAGAGAGAGTAAVEASKPSEVILQAGAPLTVRLTAPLTLLVGRDQ